MAKKFLTSISLEGNELQNLQLQQLPSDPDPSQCKLYQRSSDGQVRFYNTDTSTWKPLLEGLTVQAPLTKTGTGSIPVLGINDATTSTSGAMSAADKTKLDGIEAGASGDQNAGEVPYNNGTSGLGAAHVQAAIDEVDGNLDTHLGDTSNPHGVTKAQVGLSNVENTQHNLTASADPTTTDDSGSGYSVGSIWINTQANTAFICVDDTASNAVWVDTTSGAAGDITFSSYGNLASTNVQSALEELEDEKANATHSHTHDQVTDFDTGVQANRLDQLAAPTQSVNANGQNITNVADGVNPGDAVNKAQLDQAAQGTVGLQPSRVATTGNITLSGTQTVDGVSLQAGDRVLVKDQTDATENGIYVAASGAWSRAADADEPSELKAGNYTYVEEGATHISTTFAINTTGEITIGATDITWTILSASAETLAGNGLTKSGTTINAVAGTGLAVTADEIAIDTSLVARKYSASIGDGSATSFSVTHNFNTRDVQVSVREAADPWAEVMTDVEMNTLNAVTVRFATAPTAGEYRVTVIG